MRNASTKESELADALEQSQRRERLLEAKLKNQLARYTRLEKKVDCGADPGLEAELSQCKNRLRRSERRSQHVLAELAQNQDEYRTLEQVCAQAQHNCQLSLSREQAQAEEIERIKVSFQELKSRLKSGSESFKKMSEDWEAEKSVRLRRDAERDALECRLTQSYIANERLKTEVLQQRQKIMQNHYASLQKKIS